MLKEEIESLKDELKKIRQTNDNLLKLLELGNENKPSEENVNITQTSHDTISSKVTYADKLNNKKKSNKKPSTSEEENAKPTMKTNINPNVSKDINTSNYTDMRAAKRNDRKSNTIYGTAESDCAIKAVARYAHLHVYRLDPDLSVEQLSNYLKTKNILNSKVEKLQSKYPEQYSSFKVSVPLSCLEDIKNPNLWPKDTGINRFFYRLQKKEGTT